MIVAFHNTRGCVGSTTLVVHMCALAQELGLRVAGGSFDWGHEVGLWLADLKIPYIQPDWTFGSKYELTVIDVGRYPQPRVTPDVWVVPITDTTSAEHACDVSDGLQGSLIWLGNKGHDIGRVPEYLRGVVEVARPVPFSRALARAYHSRSIIWNAPELAGSAGAAALRTSLEDVLNRAYTALGGSLSHAIMRAKMRAMLSEALEGAEVSPETASATGEPNDAQQKPETPGPALDLMMSFVNALGALRNPAPSAESPTAGEVLSMTTAAEPHPPTWRSADLRKALVVDPGMSALIDHVRAELATKPDPKAGWSPRFRSPQTRLAAVTGHQTIDAWLAALHRDGQELVCGLRTAEEIARNLGPGVAVAEQARLHPRTLDQFKAQPGSRKMETFVRLVVASGRTDLIELQHRVPEVADFDPRPETAAWPDEGPTLHAVN